MNKTRPLEQGDKASLQQATSPWLGVLTSAPPVDLPTFSCQLVAGEGRSKKLFLRHQVDSVPPLYAERAGCGVIFDGALYNRRDLERELGDFLTAAASNDAEIILLAYERWGEGLLNRLRGTFSLVIWDSDSEIFMCLRDPLGNHPLFYAETHGELLVSSTISALTEHPHVSGAVNRGVMADYILDRHAFDETFFEAVRRVPPGHVLRLARRARSLFRYWDPA